ncbi:MAG: methionine--tRNA ligase subunit beta [Candidatus Eisenbacteria sp.]|nr:methionine--tRNA ligase subunit beta [Candidatus Eisenbacteria bacterium]
MMESDAGAAAAGKPEVTYEAFAALDLRAANVIAAEKHPDADKLLVLRIDLGELGERQIIAGIAQQYQPEELVGKTIIVVANLKPVRLRGIESRGMLLATQHDDAVTLLTGMGPIPPGAAVS